ncbi:MAG: hypothetical protein AVDCRST_MAG45-125 [uncultured Solirubrobacterales bacterium]|uniref:Glycerophosphoryl diester phosphodiesterase membrane domain-containing protein n=1 Tax=uncultured Solirubrobacterales bacterium TaxID=768556 RepID=A0A6J4RW33_9ACTN|nr:MAG: hypothetical protein AVDCRST_MAG45-125 [uncultured Solirubrobacterales bacterium]
MSYGEILKTAFAITRRNRYLWFFGLFAGGVSSFNLPTNFSPPSGGGDDPAAGALPSVDPAVIIVAVGAILLLVVAAIALGLIAQGALVESVAAIDRGGERRFKTAWKSGTRTFWRVLGWAALLVAIAVGILIVVGVPLGGIAFGVFSATESLGVRIAVGVILALLAIAALIVLLVPLQIIGALAVRDLVLREERPVAAFRNGYRMFRAQLGPSLLVWLIQFGITIGVTIVTLVLVLGLTLAVAVPTIALFAADLAAAGIAALVLAALILIPLFLAVIGALGTFTHSIWTLAYLRLGRGGQQPAV